MYDLTRRVANTVWDYDNEKPTREDKRAFRAWLSGVIIDKAKDAAKYGY